MIYQGIVLDPINLDYAYNHNYFPKFLISKIMKLIKFILLYLFFFVYLDLNIKNV